MDVDPASLDGLDYDGDFDELDDKVEAYAEKHFPQLLTDEASGSVIPRFVELSNIVFAALKEDESSVE